MPRCCPFSEDRKEPSGVRDAIEVADHLPERCLQDFLAAYLPIQAPCFPFRLALGLPVKRSLQFPNSRCRLRLRRCLYPLRAITLFSVCLERISTTAPPSLPPVFGDFLAAMQDSDSCPRPCSPPLVAAFAWQIVESIAQEMYIAALPVCLRQSFHDRPLEPRMVVTDGEKYAL
jgi:hypothetical protein